METFIVALTGASGSIYGIRLVEELLKSGNRIHLILSKQAVSVFVLPDQLTPVSVLIIETACFERIR